MMRNLLYYRIKPFIPRAVRLTVRRWFIRRKLERVRDFWPVYPGSEIAPDGWAGWPEGRKFAVVLTHDIEGPEGIAKCRRLMRLEMEMGFRSSFNFIPEGDYPVPSDLQAELVAKGFEIGVHDLHHDGRLYSTRQGFLEKARRINHYLKKWGAAGFRGAFMFHELDWLRRLEVEYDSSTFDTDPFEPDPEHVKTIFPFVVGGTGNGGTGRRGYVELPYTLPQDSTLFLLLREPDTGIWVKKLDWIARQGGMALLNVHPDYVRFDGEPPSMQTYSVELYRRFLRYLRERYQDACWHALPRQVAAYVRRLPHPPRLRRRMNVGMVTHSFYESDNRVTRYAESLARAGHRVEVVALRQNPEMPAREVIRGVSVFRIQDRFNKTAKSKMAFLLPLLRFLAVSSAWLMRRHRRLRYDLVHVHNIPDFMVFAAWYPKLCGTRVILDIHDILPEFFASKFGARAGSIQVRVLKWLEKISASFADHVIISNELWLKTYVARSASAGKCSVFINHVDDGVFHPRPRQQVNGRRVVLFPGSLEWHQGVDIAIRAFSELRRRMPEAEFHIYGDGIMKPELIKLAGNLGLNGSVRFFKPVRIHEIAEAMGGADLGVVPKRAESFGNEAYSTKIMEFMALGVPVVVSGTRIDRFYFNDSVVRFFEPGNTEALAQSMFEVLTDPSLRTGLSSRAMEYAKRNNWENRKGEYLRLVGSLCDGSAGKKSCAWTAH